jgi:hypothetical protein
MIVGFPAVLVISETNAACLEQASPGFIRENEEPLPLVKIHADALELDSFGYMFENKQDWFVC